MGWDFLGLSKEIGILDGRKKFFTKNLVMAR
jgi:hypothetical protein